MGMTCASFRISRVPIHTWCHIHNLHVRPSDVHKFHFIHGAMNEKPWELHVHPFVFHKFHFIYGALYGNDTCVLPYSTSSNSCMLPYMEVTCASFRMSQVPHGTIDDTIYGTTSRYHNYIWHQVSHIWYHITHSCTPYMAFLQGYLKQGSLFTGYEAKPCPDSK